MKRESYILFGILIVAVGLLYFLHFSSKDKFPDNLEDLITVTNSIDTEAIVYIDFDTLLMNYEFYFDLQEQLNTKRQNLEAELNSESSVWEQQYADFQDKVQKGLITRARAAEMEQQLGIRQQELLQLRDNLQMQLMEEERVMNNQLQYSILEFLEEYNKKHNYQFILSKSLGGALLFANTQLNITHEIIEGINEKYLKEKNK